MPLDLSKLRAAKKQPRVIDPVEIFRRLPKEAEIKDLYDSQTEVLNAWFADRAKPDHVVKLHTGGGKTVVGLLMAQSIINETSEPVVFICPNNHLVAQTLKKAAGAPQIAPVGPDADAPAVCVIDSAIQEAHIFIQPAIDQPTSYCFLAGKQTTDVGDFVEPGGHGTRVSGAVLYGETVPPMERRSFPSGFRTRGCSTSRTRCPKSSSRRRFCARRSRDFTPVHGKPGFSIIRSMRAAIAAHDTCRPGPPRSTC